MELMQKKGLVGMPLTEKKKGLVGMPLTEKKGLEGMPETLKNTDTEGPGNK